MRNSIDFFVATDGSVLLPVTRFVTSLRTPAASNLTEANPASPSLRGFTLIELLVVIVIIAALASLLFPAVAAMRKRADQTTCISNLRQVVIASHLAAAENDGRFPNMHGYAWEPGAIWIADALAPYAGGIAGKDPAKVMRCPATEKNTAEAWLKDPQYAHYRFNIFYGQDKRPLNAPNALLFFDTTYPDWIAAQFSHSPGGGAFLNAAYADGHVVSLTYSQYKKLNPGTDESQNDFFTLGWIK
ncbi:MAG: hypothetical protein QOH39_2702 [Verrucomicrobiota bacterium]|jgi:prepilin-type N-terminal cleavage/methylation domain-containing protein/prepilin-type processing-associated H-X9-DG protein